MGRITVTVDDHVLRRIRARAVQQGTSPAALVREYLEAFAARDASTALALQTLLSLSAAPPARATAAPKPIDPPQHRLRLIC